MLRSVEKRRDVDARYYKPVCLLAVIDGIADGSLAPSDLDPERVRERFRRYVAPIFPDRAEMGWRPFWHLSRDGAWIFEHQGRVVGPEDFKRQRKPNSPRELLSRTDHVFVPGTLREFWRSSAARDELRAAVVEMLTRDNEDCRRLAAFLAAPAISAAMISPIELGVADADSEAPRQGFRTSLVARQAIEHHAMEIVAQHLAHQGWQVEDVSARRSYDFHATRVEQDLYVEVKGTTGTGDQVLLTAAEVAFAKEHQPQMLLVVVSGIHLTMDAAGNATASEGETLFYENWAPGPGTLSPISFFCTLTPSMASRGCGQTTRLSNPTVTKLRGGRGPGSIEQVSRS